MQVILYFKVLEIIINLFLKFFADELLSYIYKKISTRRLELNTVKFYTAEIILGMEFITATTTNFVINGDQFHIDSNGIFFYFFFILYLF